MLDETISTGSIVSWIANSGVLYGIVISTCPINMTYRVFWFDESSVSEYPWVDAIDFWTYMKVIIK
jgi:uncharacterized protein YcfL